MLRLIAGLFKLFMIIFVILLLCIFYAFKIEPYRLKVNEYTLNRAEEGTVPVKIVQFSDMHIKEDFDCKNLERVVDCINEQEADIVLFTGDLYDDYERYSDDENVINELSRINARCAKIAVWGNRDYGGGAAAVYEDIMEESGFKLLKNGNWYITVGEGKHIMFTGLDDSMLGTPYMKSSTKIYNSDYEILLSHEPDVVDEYVDYEYDVLLSGHSHGGQINIPFLPFINEMAISSTSFSTKYSGGFYTFEEYGDKTLYVNTGIGTTHISARLGVVPEVAVFNVNV